MSRCPSYSPTLPLFLNLPQRPVIRHPESRYSAGYPYRTGVWGLPTAFRLRHPLSAVAGQTVGPGEEVNRGSTPPLRGPWPNAVCRKVVVGTDQQPAARHWAPRGNGVMPALPPRWLPVLGRLAPCGCTNLTPAHWEPRNGSLDYRPPPAPKGQGGGRMAPRDATGLGGTRARSHHAVSP